MSNFSSRDTIDIGGVSRPRLNSSGVYIHATDEGIRNFWQWFADSAMIDEKGRPLILYHGTDADFTAFSASTIGGAQEGKLFSGSGFYFADRRHDAGYYGEKTIAVYLKAEKLLDMRNKEAFKLAFKDQIPRDQESSLGEIIQCYDDALRQLDIQDVIVIAEGNGFFDVQWKIADEWHSNWPRRVSSLELSDDPSGMLYATSLALPKNPDAFLSTSAYSQSSIDAALDGIFDGVIAHGSIGHLGDEYVVFEPLQIKSANGNSGDFSSLSSNLYDAEWPADSTSDEVEAMSTDSTSDEVEAMSTGMS